jgi:putative oxidoreductase
MSMSRSLSASPRPFVLLEHLFDLLERVPLSLLQLLFRIAVGAVFFRSGLVKIQSWDSTVALFAYEYNVPLLPPAIAATLAASIELSAPVLLLVGFGARFAAAAMLGMTAVIQIFVYPQNWPDHILWFSLLSLIIVRGAGNFSLDALMARRFLGARHQRI